MECSLYSAPQRRCIVKTAVLAVLPIAALAAACASAVPPAAKAAEVERIQCESGAVAQRDLAVIRSVKVIDSEPLYSYMASNAGDNSGKVVDGAKIVVRPPEGVSAEQLSRALQCHSAQVLLGEQSKLAADPFWLPGTWLNIEVKPEHGNYAVTLEADTVADNLKLAAHAMAFAKAQAVAGNSVDQ
jgi:hypothetical protein